MLDKICDLVASKNSNAIFYLSLFDHTGESSASAQYIMKMTDIIGLPVIVALGDNPGNVQVKCLFFIMKIAFVFFLNECMLLCVKSV